MRKLVCFAATALTLAAFSAKAADVVEPAPVEVVAETFSWTGLYIGVKGGGGWSDTSLEYETVPGIDNGSDGDGWFLGGRVGYNYQFSNNVVLGAELEGSWADVDGGIVCPINALFTCNHEIDAFGSINARLGYAFDRFLLQVNGGYAFADAENFAVLIASPATSLESIGSRDGWTIGAGVEYAATDNIILDLGYKYYDFGSEDGVVGVPPTDAATVDLDLHTVFAGISYKF